LTGEDNSQNPLNDMAGLSYNQDKELKDKNHPDEKLHRLKEI
jgi:hypothetical protein